MRSVVLLLSVATLAACQTAEVLPPAPEASSEVGAAVYPSDFETILGETWAGELTYLDYSSGETVAIPATLSVGPIAGQVINYAFGYPGEPQANNAGTWTISEDGSSLDDKPVVSRTVGDNGDLILVMEYEGEDDDAPAAITETLILTENGIVMTKIVTPEGEAEGFQRNSFAFSR